MTTTTTSRAIEQINEQIARAEQYATSINQTITLILTKNKPHKATTKSQNQTTNTNTPLY